MHLEINIFVIWWIICFYYFIHLLMGLFWPLLMYFKRFTVISYWEYVQFYWNKCHFNVSNLQKKNICYFDSNSFLAFIWPSFSLLALVLNYLAQIITYSCFKIVGPITKSNCNPFVQDWWSSIGLYLAFFGLCVYLRIRIDSFSAKLNLDIFQFHFSKLSCI